MENRPPTRIEIPPVFGDFSVPKRYRVWYGGRGSGKSWAVARVLVALAATRPIRILCCREFQNSIQDSAKKLLADQIEALGLLPWFTITETSIKSAAGAEFLFKGLARNVQGIKSTEGVDICWVEEAQTISQQSVELLIPTIRKSGSELWFTYNPENETDPMHRLMVSLAGSGNALVQKVNWSDNPWFPPELDEERQRLLKNDPEAYEHIWEGECRTISEALIFRNKYEVRDFDTPEGARFFFGVDWGFSQDPTAVVRAFIQEDCLFIDHEAYSPGIELDHLPAFFDRIPEIRKWPIHADNARPETISYVKRQGFNISPADKWKGSVEDGIEYLKSFHKIVIHPRCRNTAKEFSMYSYKVDKRSGDILPVPEDKFNHILDSLRYSLHGYIRKRGMPVFKKSDLARI